MNETNEVVPTPVVTESTPQVPQTPIVTERKKKNNDRETISSIKCRT